MFSLMYFVLLPSHLTHQSPIVSAYGLPIFSAVHVKVKKNLQFLDDSRHDVFENVGQGEFGYVWVHICEILQSFWVSLDSLHEFWAWRCRVGGGGVGCRVSSAVHLADVSRDPRLSGPSGSRLSAFA